MGDWCDRWTKTNAYSAGGYEGAGDAAPRAPKAHGEQDAEYRTGVSRPAEVERHSRCRRSRRRRRMPTPPPEKDAETPQMTGRGLRLGDCGSCSYVSLRLLLRRLSAGAPPPRGCEGESVANHGRWGQPCFVPDCDQRSER